MADEYAETILSTISSRRAFNDPTSCLRAGSDAFILMSGGLATVDHQRRPSHERRGVRSQVDGGADDLVYFTDATHRDRGFEELAGALVRPQPCIQIGCDPSRRDRVDAHSRLSE